MIGGILSNNSSGMCCGVSQNAYHTLDSLTFVLPSGTVIDTANARADEDFRAKEPRLADGLVDLKRQIETNYPLYNRIRAKYRMKNTTGYSLNAFIDFERPVDIFQHVLIGSEGTLAFIAEAVLNTVPDLPVKYTGLLLFPNLHAAAAAIVPLRDAGAAALEIMDRAALRSVEDQPGISPSIRKLPGEAAGLLVEFQAASESERAALESVARREVEGLKLQEAPVFTHQAAEQAALWKIRAGMFPSVGAVRKSGTTVIIEDVAFPIQHLADATVDLQKLFLKHGYDNGIIFGHAKDGNLHFVITQSFNDQKAIDQYAHFIDDLIKLVVERYDGALKAEHGTGRNMAPFVEAEWGGDAYRIMKRLKELVDPDSLLNPDVIINSDPKGHLADLKRMPVVEDEVDKCIECGYCEPKCPSRNLTLTPRQRIVVRREMQRLKDSGGNGMSAALDAEFPYMALETCAVDGLCATACPVSIDTGQLTKRFRRMRHSKSAQARAVRFAKNFAALERRMRLGLRLGHMVQSALGMGAMVAITRTIRSFGRRIPAVERRTCRSRQALVPRTERANAQAIYFPTCISRVLGRLPGETAEQSLMEVLVTLARRAGVPVFIPGGRGGRLLRGAVLLQGLRPGARRAGEPDDREVLPVVRRRQAAGGHRHHPVHLRDRHLPSAPHAGEPGEVRQPEDSRQLTVRARPVAAQAEGHAEGGLGGAAPGLLGHQAEPRAEARGNRARLQRQSRGAAECRLLRLRRRPRLPLSRTHRVGDARRGRRTQGHGAGRLLLQQPHLRNRHEAGHGTGVRVVSVFVGAGDTELIRRGLTPSSLRVETQHAASLRTSGRTPRYRQARNALVCDHVSGHEFTRAVTHAKSIRASAPDAHCRG